MKHIKTAVIIFFAWGIATITHEFGHILVARCFGFAATLHTLNYNTASVMIHGVMTPFETTVIATGGSTILILLGAILIALHLKTIGLVFVLRSWIDMIPIGAKDGSIIAESSGLAVAIVLLVIEVMICGVIIYYTRRSFFFVHF